MLTFDFKKINLPPHSKVLDVGCGDGILMEYLSKNKGILL